MERRLRDQGIPVPIEFESSAFALRLSDGVREHSRHLGVALALQHEGRVRVMMARVRGNQR